MISKPQSLKITQTNASKPHWTKSTLCRGVLKIALLLFLSFIVLFWTKFFIDNHSKDWQRWNFHCTKHLNHAQYRDKKEKNRGKQMHVSYPCTLWTIWWYLCKQRHDFRFTRQQSTLSVRLALQRPVSSSRRTMCVCPCSLAHISAVDPSQSWAFTSAPQLRSSFTMATRPCLTASISAVWPAWRERKAKMEI